MQNALTLLGVELEELKDCSPRTLVNEKQDIFLLHLELTYEDQAASAFHFTAFHAETGAILEPMSGNTAVIVDDVDRCVGKQVGEKKRNRAAMRPFYATFGMDPQREKILITRVYKATRIRQFVTR